MTSRRRLLGPLAGLLISLVFLTLALRGVRFDEVTAALAAADYRLVLLSAVLTFCSYVLRTARWARFLQPQKRIPVRRLFPVLVVGFALNNLFPARPGELARAISLGQRETLSKTLGLATVVVERVADGLTLIAVLAAISLVLPLPGWGRQAEAISVAIFVAALCGLLVLLWQQSLAARLLGLAVGFAPKRIGDRLSRMFNSFILGLHSLRSPRNVVAIALLSLAIWTSEAAHYFLILSAFGLVDGAPLRGLAAAFMMVVVNLSVAIPAAPGGLGPFEWAGSLALGTLGVPAARALSAVLIAHTVQYLLVTVMGIVFGAREGLRLTQAVGQTEVE